VFGALEGIKFLFTEEVSELIRVPVATLRYWRHVGKGPKSVRIGSRIMYREADVIKWIEAAYDGETA
jgi:DNA-binding transcriptional MerR regulator